LGKKKKQGGGTASVTFSFGNEITYRSPTARRKKEKKKKGMVHFILRDSTHIRKGDLADKKGEKGKNTKSAFISAHIVIYTEQRESLIIERGIRGGGKKQSSDSILQLFQSMAWGGKQDGELDSSGKGGM